MQAPSTDLDPHEAARMLAWLIEMGADEILAESPQDRFGEEVVTKPPAAKPPLRPPPKMTEPSPAAAQPVNVEEAARLAARCQTLNELQDTLQSLDIAGLRKSALRFCFLEAAPNARVLVLGDRPRTEEEQDGGVFAGKTAILLRNMLKAIGLAFPDGQQGEPVSLANLVPWRPPGNQPPSDVMVAHCAPFARRLVELMQPSLILTLGALPARALAGAGNSIPQQRGKWHALAVAGREIPLLPTFHPAELLRFPQQKRLVWEDLRRLRDRLAAQ